MRAPVSVCIITLGEPSLAAAIASVRPWVEEVCVLHTRAEPGSYLPSTVDRFAEAKWSDDFAAARNASYAMATQPYIAYLDSDDTLENGAELANLVSWMDRTNSWAWLPYDYEHDALGNVTCQLMLPRIVTRGDFEWRFPVHEQLVPLKENPKRVETKVVRVKHHRTMGGAVSSTERNIRILRAALEKDSRDTRSMFYLICSMFDARDFAGAEHWAAPFMHAAVPDDQKAIVCRRLSTVWELKGDLQRAQMYAMASLSANPVAESYFAVARVHRAAAEQHGSKREWAKVRHFCEVGMSLGETENSLWANPMERFHANEMCAHACAALGEKSSAVAHAAAALTFRDDEDLRHQVEAWRSAL